MSSSSIVGVASVVANGQRPTPPRPRSTSLPCSDRTHRHATFVWGQTNAGEIWRISPASALPHLQDAAGKLLGLCGRCRRGGGRVRRRCRCARVNGRLWGLWRLADRIAGRPGIRRGEQHVENEADHRQRDKKADSLRGADVATPVARGAPFVVVSSHLYLRELVGGGTTDLYGGSHKSRYFPSWSKLFHAGVNGAVADLSTR